MSRKSRSRSPIHPAAPAGSGGAGHFCPAQPLGIDYPTAEALNVGLYPMITGKSLKRWQDLELQTSCNRAAIEIHGKAGVKIQDELSAYDPGPAYSTIAAASGKGNHYLQVVHYDRDGHILSQWFETSGPGGLRGHTEARALSRIDVKAGESLLFIGEYAPCNYDGGCHELMSVTARRTGADIVYFEVGEDRTRSVRFYEGGIGHVRAPTSSRSTRK